MIYKEFQGLKLSALGMGCMRLPVVEGDNAAVDQTAVEEMVACAMAGGVNYYDTAGLSWRPIGDCHRQSPGPVSPGELLSGG